MTKCPKCGKDLLLIEIIDRTIRCVTPVNGLSTYNDGEVYFDYGEEEEDDDISTNVRGYECDKCGATLFDTELEAETFLKANPDYQKED